MDFAGSLATRYPERGAKMQRSVGNRRSQGLAHVHFANEIETDEEAGTAGTVDEGTAVRISAATALADEWTGDFEGWGMARSASCTLSRRRWKEREASAATADDAVDHRQWTTAEDAAYLLTSLLTE